MANASERSIKMIDKYRLDSHKFHYHADAIYDFLQGNEARPIYVEISPTGFCNHHCVFCHYNYLGHKGLFPDGRMLSLLDELKSLKVKSVVFAGIGEPTLHKETVPAILKAKNLGLDVAMSTNGALLKDKDFDILANTLTWIRFSFNASSAKDYGIIHKTKESDFDLVLSNISKLVEAKKKNNTKITIGMQYILMPQNVDGIENLAKIAKDIGVDYLVIKHFYPNENNDFKTQPEFPHHTLMKELYDLSITLSDENFSFIVRSPDVLIEDRVYDKCYGLPYVLYVREDGDVYSCFAYQDNKNMVLGNVFKDSMVDIWSSEQKKNGIDYINNCVDKKKCQPSCRHHQINNYLWSLKYPPEHINFI
jgi:radical SAM protein with 4Fe4S-binding SPASM domain